jgi:two-component system chemotaxis sensor kinase CheA
VNAPFAIPEPLLARFRTMAFERLERVDAAWVELSRGGGTPKAEQQMFRDLHTLKGDARVIGLGDVALLCQRLEDLLFAARVRRYRVHEDVDIVVTMAIQFVGMLVRKKVGAPRIGIDLEGFLKQIEEVISEWLRRSSEAPGLGVPLAARPRLVELAGRISAPSRARLSVAATNVYLEHLRASGGARKRLRDVWETLAQEVSSFDSVPVQPLLDRHAAAAADLAKELGKEIEVSATADDVELAAEVIDTLNTALVHTIRNAVDHGIEMPDERRAGGKSAAGSLRIRGVYAEDSVEFVVADDGAGVDLGRVRARAREKRLLTETEAARASEGQLIEILFQPGFSTRDLADAVSGRGIGMDAVRASTAQLGGHVVLETLPGAGTTVTVSLPQRRGSIEVRTFTAEGAPTLLAVPATAAVSLVADEGGPVIDPIDVLELDAVRDAVREKGAAAGPKAVVLVKEGDTVLRLRARGPVRTGVARRLCATPSDSLTEIVGFEGSEVILLRTEVLAASVAAEARS